MFSAKRGWVSYPGFRVSPRPGIGYRKKGQCFSIVPPVLTYKNKMYMGEKENYLKKGYKQI